MRSRRPAPHPECDYGCGTEILDARTNSAMSSSTSTIDRPSSCRLLLEAAIVVVVESRPSRGLGVTNVAAA